MELTYVKKLVKLLSESDVDEIEIEEEGKKVRVAKHSRNSVGIQPVAMSMPQQVPAPAAFQTAAPVAPPPAPEPAAPSAAKLHEVKSPIVGTFYRSPAPDAAPYVEVGSVVQSGSVLCIVEAMKLMNEIESDVSGRIAKVMVENQQPVEYGQVLFLVEKT